MKADEIIRFSIQEKGMEKILEDTIFDIISYAVLSVPFTINRMKILNMNKRINNIIKGKLAERLFMMFIEENKYQGFDFYSTQTEYYQIDKGDFIFKGYEWDIKNNFVHCENFSDEDIINFLALVPEDQWKKRFNINFQNKAREGKAFLFTFIRDSIFKRKREIEMPSEILTKLENYCSVYEGKQQYTEPQKFKEEISNLLNRYRKKIMDEIKENLDYSKLEIIITAYATKEEFPKFKDFSPGKSFNTSEKEICFTTRIDNKGIEVKELPSFKSLLDKAGE